MKKLISIALFIATVFLLTACTGGAPAEGETGINPFGSGRFISYSAGWFDEVYVDRATGVCYLFVNGMNRQSGGLAVLVDADGKPLIYKEAIKNAAD